MAKKNANARNLALELYLNTKTTKSDIAAKLGVSTRTITSWALKDKWDEKLSLHQATPQDLELDLIKILSQLNKQYLEEQDPSERVRISDQVAKFNKTLENLRKEKRLSLTQIISVLKDLISYAETTKPKILPELIDLQDQYIRTKSNEYL